MIGPCADGHFGATIKAYREWRNSEETTPGFGAFGRTSGARLNMRGRRKIPTVGTRTRQECSGAAAPHARHGAVRSELLADEHVCRER